MNWTDASAECENNGSHLVTVTTAGENQFVTSLLKAHFSNGMTQVTVSNAGISKLLRAIVLLFYQKTSPLLMLWLQIMYGRRSVSILSKHRIYGDRTVSARREEHFSHFYTPEVKLRLSVRPSVSHIMSAQYLEKFMSDSHST